MINSLSLVLSLISIITTWRITCNGQIQSQVEQDVENSNHYLWSGLAKYKSKDYQGALSNWDMAIKSNPSNWVAFRRMGDAQSKLNKYREAIISYSKALSINARDTLSLKGRAESRRMVGNFHEA